MRTNDALQNPRGGGGGGTPLYKQYRYVPPHRVGFLRRLGLEIKSNHCVKCLTTYVQYK